MLQQTQVQTVIPYFNRWMQAFPSLQDLADAPEATVLHLWEGLGFYRRARYLHAGAREVVRRFNGTLPHSVRDLLTLPGIGPYTAGAIASIAFQTCVPAVDGNVIRVIARLLAWDLQPKDPKTPKLVTSFLQPYIAPLRPGDFNQALMELGATICRPVNPSCDSCPLQTQCCALASGDPMAYPQTGIPPKITQLHAYAAVVTQNTTTKGTLPPILIEQRPTNALLANTWQFPMEDHADSLNDFLNALKSRGITLKEQRHIGSVVHRFSHRLMTIEVFEAKASEVLISSSLRWATHEEFRLLPSSRVVRKIEALFLQSGA